MVKNHYIIQLNFLWVITINEYLNCLFSILLSLLLFNVLAKCGKYIILLRY